MFGLGPIRRWVTELVVPARVPSAGLSLAEEDVEELSAIGARVAAEYGASSPAVLSANLARLIRRQVPVRAFRSGEVRCVGGLQFADGTVVLVRGRRAGDLGRLAAGVHVGPVHLDDFHAEPDGVTVDVSFGGHHERLHALGITEPC